MNSNMRLCIKCNQTKDNTEFGKNGKTKLNQCKICRNADKRKSYRKHKDSKSKYGADKWRKIVIELQCFKKKLGCYLCGEFDPRVLDFHHLDPQQKLLQVPEAWRRHGRAAGIEEINKCQVLCANCHRKEHVEDVEEIKCSPVGENI